MKFLPPFTVLRATDFTVGCHYLSAYRFRMLPVALLPQVGFSGVIVVSACCPVRHQKQWARSLLPRRFFERHLAHCRSQQRTPAVRLQHAVILQL